MIDQLWREHKAAPFPQGARGREVAGNELVLVDSTVAGCVSAFLENAALDPWRLSMLGLCYRELTLVVLELDSEERLYFGRLERLAGLVLEAVREANAPD